MSNRGHKHSREHSVGTVLFQTSDSFRNRILFFLAIPIILVVVGTIGYEILEKDYTFFDSLYMTVITLTTIGYGEIYPLSPAGRAFTIFLILGGVFTFFYASSEIIRIVVSGEVRDILGRQRMERSLSQLRDHMIVCGFGRMGRLVCQEFSRNRTSFVIVDLDPDLLADFEIPYGIPLLGDATSDEVLRHAGFERARALVTVMPTDADNLYTTMSGRLLNKDLFIVARVEDPQSEVKIKRAGANRVVSPYVIGGHRLAQAVLQPTVVDFIELASQREHVELQLEETQITRRSPLAGRTIRDSNIRAEFKVIVVAIKKSFGKMIFNPDPEAVLEAEDILIAIGPREQLDNLEALANR